MGGIRSVRQATLGLLVMCVLSVLVLTWQILLAQEPRTASLEVDRSSVDVAALTAPRFLDEPGTPATVTLSGPGNLFIGVARTGDAEEFLSGSPYLSLREVIDESLLQGVSQAGPNGLSDPRVSDIWVTSSAGTGQISMAWEPRTEDFSAVLVWDVASTDASTITVSWERRVLLAPVGILIFIALLTGGLSLAGFALTRWVAKAERRRPERPTPLDLEDLERIHPQDLSPQVSAHDESTWQFGHADQTGGTGFDTAERLSGAVTAPADLTSVPFLDPTPSGSMPLISAGEPPRSDRSFTPVGSAARNGSSGTGDVDLEVDTGEIMRVRVDQPGGWRADTETLNAVGVDDPSTHTHDPLAPPLADRGSGE